MKKKGYFMEGQPVISVIGSSAPPAETYELARQVGRLLARAGCTVVCGGKGGVMEAVCRGVAEEKGFSLGLLPAGIEEANPYVTLPLSTGLGEVRNVAVVSSGDAVISIGGAFGTLSEIGFALKLGKPVIALNTWSVQEPGAQSPLMPASTPEEAVELALEKARKEHHGGR